MADVVVQQNVVPAGGRDGEFRARVRAAARTWNDDGSAELAELLAEAAGGDPELSDLVRTGGALVADFLEGYRRRASRDLARDLIEGRPVRPEQEMTLASEYTVAVVRWSGADRAEVQQLESALRQAVAREVLATTAPCGLVLLIPGAETLRANRSVEQVKRFLGANGWLATATRPRRDLRDGFREAADVLRLVLAGRRPAGAYTVLDVLVEYAVVQDEAVAAELTEMIRPLRDQTVLWQTLTALLEADFQRNRAAGNLFVHRSTLDYRLQRIAAITGCDPATARGAQLLAAAVIADAVRGKAC
jgi:hypothetical protein